MASEAQQRRAAKDRERLARIEQERIAAAREQAQPLEQPEVLSEAVGELATAWGLKQRKVKQ